MSSIDLTGRVALVTGAGNGLGRSHAIALAEHGAMVVVNDLGGSLDGSGASATAAESVVAEILELGGEAVASTDDVSTPKSAAAIVETAVSAFGQLDIVVNNAGILRDKSLLKMDEESLRAIHAVHLLGTIFVSQAALPHLRESPSGRFVHTSSAAGLWGNFGQTAYSSAKAGIVGFGKTLAWEGAKYGIRSNVVAPVASSRMTESLIGSLEADLRPEQVSGLVVFLASQECELNGEVFSIGGGHVARVFTAVTEGWSAPEGELLTSQAVVENISEICQTDGFRIPVQAADEILALVQAEND